MESDPRSHDDGDRREEQWYFVADHLGYGAHGSKQRILIAARPAGHEYRQFRDGSNSEEEEHAGVEVGGDHVAADGQHCVGQEGHGQQHKRRQKMHNVISSGRYQVFFRERFQRVCQGLHHAEDAHPVGTVAVLHSAQAFAFEHRGQREQHRKHKQDGGDGEQDRNCRLQCGRGIAEEPVL